MTARASTSRPYTFHLQIPSCALHHMLVFKQVDVKGTGLEHLVNGSMGKALSVYALNPADKVRTSNRRGRVRACRAGQRVLDQNEA